MFSRLSHNSIWPLVARLATQIGMALFTVLLARQLGSAVFGAYAFIAAIVTVGNVVTTFGTDMFLIREIAATDDLSGLAPALFLQLALSTTYIAIVLMVSFFLSGLSADAVMAMRIYVLSMLPLAFFTIYTTALRGRQLMREYAVLNLALILLQLTAALLLVWLKLHLIMLAAFLLAVQCLAALFAGLLCQARLSLPRKVLQLQPRQAFMLLRSSAPIAALGLLGIFYQRFGLLALPWLAGNSATGWYSAASRVVEAAKLGHIAVFTALYPLMAQSGARDISEFSKIFRLPWWLLLAGAVIASLGLSTFASPMIVALFGSDYGAAAPLLRILSWSLVPYTVNNFLALAFLARGQARPIQLALSIGILTLVALTIWWVPLSGVGGAALAFLCAELIQSPILGLYYRRLQHLVPRPPLFELSETS